MLLPYTALPLPALAWSGPAWRPDSGRPFGPGVFFFKPKLPGSKNFVLALSSCPSGFLVPRESILLSGAMDLNFVRWSFGVAVALLSTPLDAQTSQAKIF